MSLYGVMGTAISGMVAQSNRLGTVGDNIANSSTTGYKRADTQFETLLGNNAVVSNYDSGGVSTVVRYGMTQQGTVQGTSSVTDLAIQGNGFFLVKSSSGATALTRAGSFVPDASGNLVNAAGYYLMGYDLHVDPTPSNGIAGLTKVNVAQGAMKAVASTTGIFTANLPSTATAVPAANLPSTNSASSTYTAKASMIAYDNLGTPITLDVYMSKTSANTWEVSVYNQANAATGGGFPYSAGQMASTTLQFDGTTGKLATSSPSSISVAIPNGSTLAIDLSGTTQMASAYSVLKQSNNGSAPSIVDHVEISKDGVLTTVYANGSRDLNYKIPLANVNSPESLTAESGNIYTANAVSGDILIGSSNTVGYGAIASSSLEQSTVDLATELSNMIVAQRGYEANSKVLQTGAELLHVLTQLQT